MKKEIKITVCDAPETQNAVIMSFDGELDTAGAAKISESFLQIYNSTRNFCIADMSSVTLFSSAAMGELVRGRQNLIDKGGDLVFSGMSLEIRTKLNLMGASRIFRFYNNIRSALNAYKWEIEKNPEQVQLSFPSYLELVPPVRHLISRIARHKGYGMRDSFRIETIVDEVCNNAVEHGRQTSDSVINLDMKIDPQGVEFNITNQVDSEQLSTLKTVMKAESDSKPGVNEKRGRGLALIKMLSEEFSIDYSESITNVHVKKARRE